MSVLMTGPAKTTVVLFVLDVAKGRRFRAALASPGAALGWLNHQRTLEREVEIRSLRAASTPAGARLLDQNMLLTSYVSPSEMRGGADPAEQLRNLQIRFDNALDRNSSNGADDEWLPTNERLQSLLDDRVVLLIQHIGANLQESLTLTTLISSRLVNPKMRLEKLRPSSGRKRSCSPARRLPRAPCATPSPGAAAFTSPRMDAIT
jgi:hypothetical protein